MNFRSHHPRRLLACLGHDSRYRLALSLASDPCCVSELAGRIGLSQSCTTRHLQALERERVVEWTRDGKRVIYRLRVEVPRVAALLRWAFDEGEIQPGLLQTGGTLHQDRPPRVPAKSPRSVVAAGAPKHLRNRAAAKRVALARRTAPAPPPDPDPAPPPAPEVGFSDFEPAADYRPAPRHELEDYLL